MIRVEGVFIMNHNEEFKQKLIYRISEELNAEFSQQRIIDNIVNELLQDYTVSSFETAITVSDVA